MKIKVRAWTGKRMLYKGLHDHSWYDSPVGGSHVCEHDQNHEQRFKTMLWTGLKDMKGNEIYEGDILKYFNWILPITVESNHGFRFLWGLDQINKATAFDGEVVGNIYENPDMEANGYKS